MRVVVICREAPGCALPKRGFDAQPSEDRWRSDPCCRSIDPARADAENKLADLSPLMDDFASTAALIEQLDLVITIDTAVAHLAGALGKPTWLLLSAAPDWRWMLGRSDSPWYPSMRLFRQAKLGDWSDPLAKLRAELARTV